MKKLERQEMKNLRGGMDEVGGGGGETRWCLTDSDCAPIYYQCSSGGTYQSGQGSCRYGTFPPHCVWGIVCG